MAYYRNDNSHGINPTGNQRVAPGQVVQGDKEYEVAGVTKLSDAEGKKAVKAQDEARQGASSDPTGDMVVQDAFAEQRRVARQVSVAAPLQVVVGDDQAPLGPPTGELSTKQDEAKKDLAHRIAFADHEANEKVDEPDEKLTPHGVAKSQVVHNQQAEAIDATQEVAEEIVSTLQDASSGKSSDDDEE